MEILKHNNVKKLKKSLKRKELSLNQFLSQMSNWKHIKNRGRSINILKNVEKLYQNE